MIKQSDLINVISSQRSHININNTGLQRVLLEKLPANLKNHALIISGIHRCGKSTLLAQILKNNFKNTFFLNFDTPKLYNFELSDFELLDRIIKESKQKILFFDEIQVINGWELYIRQKLDEKFKVVITGSNASLLSKELGTKLTGRYLTKELFPFNYSEFIKYKSLKSNKNSFVKFLETGGFPEYLKTKNPDVLSTLFDDILYRDIAVRYGIRDVNSLKKLLIYLISNVGNLITANKLVQIINIKSTATILDYFSYFEQSYLINFMPKFSYSYRKQIVNPRKIYAIDNGLINAVSTSYSQDIGRKFENYIYWEFRSKQKELYYFNENNSECDFVICKNNKPEELIQVCYELNTDNFKREEKGLLDAMNFFNLKSGIILTIDQTDKIKHNNKNIFVIPAYKYFSKQNLT